MTALYTALLEGETKASLVRMVCELREENARLREENKKLRRSLYWINKVVRDAMPKETP